MKIGTRVQFIRNLVTKIDSFLILEIGTVIDREYGKRCGIEGAWCKVEFNKEKYAMPYWCLEKELREVK